MSTYTPIASQTLTSAASSVTFSNIPQTYTDLILVTNASNASTDSNIGLQFNSDTATNYSSTRLSGDGSTASSSRTANLAYVIGGRASATGTRTSNGIVHIMNYSNATTYKTVLTRSNNSATIAGAYVGMWRSTSAITSIVVYNINSANFESGSTFNLYGIATSGINTGKAIGGDNVYSDGTYWYHTFLSSGTFTPLQSLTADYLVVAGGGSGGTNLGGGGGAGGMRCTVTATGGGGSLESALSLTAQAYTVTIGAGGAAAIANNNRGNSGSNSVFSTITATGGGGGGNRDFSNGNGTSPSGGGGYGSTGTGASGTANQSYAGGNAYTAGGVYGAGGGGGTGAAGANGTSLKGGNGGNGIATSISGSSITYGGGGGGGADSGTVATGGSGGGGNGAVGNGTPVAGSANSGSGGGGSGGFVNSAAGGSGIVIVRYAV